MIKNLFWILITVLLAPVFYGRIFLRKLFKRKDLRILIIDTAKIGDLVCATPVFREIKKKFPRAHLTAAIREQNYGVIQNNPHINEFLFLNSDKYQGFSGTIRLIKELSNKKFDYSVNLSPYFLTTILPFLAGIPVRLTSISRITGRTTRLLSLFNTHRLEYRQHTSKLRHNLELLKFLEIKDFNEKKRGFYNRKRKEKSRRIFRKQRSERERFYCWYNRNRRQ